MIKPKIAFFDIDGTLVSFKTHQVPESTKQAICQLRQKGVKVYIATGRPLQFIDNLQGVEYDGMITVNGSFCFANDGTHIYHHFIDKHDIEAAVLYNQKARSEANEAKQFPIFFVHSDGVFATAVNEEVREVAQLLHIQMPEMLPATEALDKDILQVISFFPADREDELMTQLFPHATSMRWFHSFTDIIAKGSSKSNGIDKVLEYEGIPLEETISFGDGGNDINMLSHTAIGVAMGNAADNVKAAANYVTDSVDDNGIANALRHFGLID